MEFFREYVSKNYPVLIKGGISHLSAVQKWDSEYFLNLAPNKEILVTVTPNGYADGIAMYNGREYFFLPEEVKMKFHEFLDTLEKRQENYVSYIQQQNSNLTTYYPELLSDVDVEIDWASKAFNKQPDAVNIWMGDDRAITSIHKDPYENIYCVIDGYKDFILIPPVDLPYVPYKNFPVKKYKNVTPKCFDVEDCTDPESIFWISADPLKQDHSEIYPDFYRKARKFHVRVEKGDMLYLPSLWFHHVSQSHKCIAINYWYDIEYSDPKYCYYRMLASLCGKDKYT